MKLLLTALLASVAMPALAADLPAKAPVRPVAPVADWTGFYFGIHGGYGWGDIKPDDFNIADAVDGLSNPNPKGWVFGGQAGYLWQYGRFVGGLEVDYSAADLKDTQGVTFNVFDDDIRVGTLTLDLASKIDALASARARAGFLLADSLYLYGTAGIGWGHSKVDVAATACNLQARCESLTLAAARTNHFGWVAGGGLEWRFTQTLSLRGEFLHYDFGSTTHAFQTPILFGVNVNAKTTVDVARGALNFRF